MDFTAAKTAAANLRPAMECLRKDTVGVLALGGVENGE
jgi:hypothetical protein